MSIESKHAYRYGYLKSEEWQNVRIEALAREGGKCQVCGEESIGNDAHHIWYPENIYLTKEHHLVILCRDCHNFVHAVRPECKTRDEVKGKVEWKVFIDAVVLWRSSKLPVFTNAEGIKTINPVLLRQKLCRIKSDLQKRPPTKQEVGKAFTEIKKMIGGFAQ